MAETATVDIGVPTEGYPTGHGDAHAALSYAPCTPDGGRAHVGCDKIDAAHGVVEIDGETYRIVDLRGSLHQRALAIMASKVTGACATCPWVTGVWQKAPTPAASIVFEVGDARS